MVRRREAADAAADDDYALFRFMSQNNEQTISRKGAKRRHKHAKELKLSWRALVFPLRLCVKLVSLPFVPCPQ
jgi:hypothetical protein